MQSKWFILKASLKTLGLETRLTDSEQVYKPIQASIAVCFVLLICFYLSCLILLSPLPFFLLVYSSQGHCLKHHSLPLHFQVDNLFYYHI